MVRLFIRLINGKNCQEEILSRQLLAMSRSGWQAEYRKPRGIFIFMNSDVYNTLPFVVGQEYGINKPIQKVRGQFKLAQWLIYVSYNTQGANIKTEEAINSSGKQIFWQEPFSVQ